MDQSYCTKNIAASTYEDYRYILEAYFRRQNHYGRERAHQGIPDHRAASLPALRVVAQRLHAQLLSGDLGALLPMCVMAIGLPKNLCLSMPLRGAEDEDWGAVLDIDLGCTLIDLDTLAPDRATPTPGSDSDALIPAGGALIRPLPCVLAKQLRALHQDKPDAPTLGDLLGEHYDPNYDLLGCDNRIRTTLPRLRNTVGPLAVSLNLNRYTAALLTLDVRLVPTGKYYYASIARADIWASAQVLFAQLSWGDPVPLVEGVDIGSSVTPQPQTVQRLMSVLVAHATALRPSKHTLIAALINHHSSYVRAVATLCTFLIAARERQKSVLKASHIGQQTLAFLDKRTGEFPGPSLVPAVPTLQRQLILFGAHCEALRRRLNNIRVPKSSALMRHLVDIAHRADVPLFFDFDAHGNIHLLGSGAIGAAWPPSLGLQRNWPRHYWQRALLRDGIHSSTIDIFLRHTLSGLDALSSTAHTSLRQRIRSLSHAIESHILDLGIAPISGLSTHITKASERKLSPTLAAGISIARDGAQRLRFRPRAGLPIACQKFSSFAENFLARGPSELSPRAQLAGLLLLAEAVLTHHDLCAALCAAHSVYSAAGVAHLDWLGPDMRPDSRQLSTMTARLIATYVDVPITVSEAEQSIAQLASWATSDSRLDTLLEAGRAWALIALPPYLLAHVLKQAPLTALPVSARARLESKLSLQTADIVPEPDAIAQALDHALGAAPLSVSHQFVGDLCARCSRAPESKTPHLARAQLIESLRALTTDLQYADSISALLLAWAMTLLESGSIRGRPVSHSTLRNYVGRVALGVHARLKGQNIDDMDGHAFDAAYADILATKDPAQRRDAATALHSWHHFLQGILDVAPIRALDKDCPVPIPAANIVWPHEIDRILAWLQSAPPSRLNASLLAAIAIASHVRIRIKELLYLRDDGIIDRGDSIEVQINRRLCDPALKTRSAQRQQHIVDVSACALIRAWVSRRTAEHMLPSDLLFGRADGSNAIDRPGALMMWLNTLFKAATGDASISFHTLSHSYISRTLETQLAAPSSVDINPIEQTSVWAGHRSAATTLNHYHHLYTRDLRCQLDAAMQGISLTANTGALWCDVLASTLRKRASVQSITTPSAAWCAIGQGKVPASITSVTTRFSLALPPPPKLSALRQKPLSFEGLLAMLVALAEGSAMDSLAYRFDITTATVETIVALSTNIILALRGTAGRRSDRCSGLPLLQAVLSRQYPDIEISMGHSQDAKLTPLRRWLSRNANSPHTHDLYAAWPALLHGRYVGLHDTTACNALIAALHQADVDIAQLAVAFASAAGNDVLHPSRLALERCLTRFELTFGRRPTLLPVAPRGDRPSSYLVWSSAPDTAAQLPTAAQSRMGGLHALIFAACIWRDWQRHLHTLATQRDQS